MRRRRKANDLRSDVSLLITSSCDDHFQTGTVFLGCFFCSSKAIGWCPHALTSAFRSSRFPLSCSTFSRKIWLGKPSQETVRPKCHLLNWIMKAEICFGTLVVNNAGIFLVWKEKLLFFNMYVSICLSFPTKSWRLQWSGEAGEALNS